MILSKIYQAKLNNLDWFYPGYFTTGYKQFDYKLDLNYENTEYYDFVKNEWQHISNFDQSKEPLSIIRKKLNYIIDRFRKNDISLQLMRYRYFDSNTYIDFSDSVPLTQPYFIIISDEEDIVEILYYNVMDEKYEIISCTRYFEVHDQQEIEDEFNNGILVMIKESRVQFDDAMEVMKFLNECLKP
jgi:hypothetical protein